MRIGIFGRGRLGAAIAEVVRESPEAELVWSAGRGEAPTGAADVVIDASSATAVEAHLQWSLDHGADFLIGTTGWTIPDLETRIGGRIGVVTAPNFSLTVALYARLSLVLARFAAQDDQKDPYLVEHHHARKHDAPSGTAKLLAGVLLRGCPRKTEWAIPAAGGDLKAHQLNVSSIRAGHTYSSHIVGVDAPGEVLELHHAARSPRPYAEGALVAARWIRGRKGLFTMDAVAKDALDPLFQEVQP
jgi:4-hydroxy-tetrahydrodipicolinate reductase